MRRKITEKLLEWKNRESHKALVVSGCRQIGKTYSLTDFAKTEYPEHLYVNFEKNPETKELFFGSKDVESIIERLELWSGKSLEPGKCLIILDEIGYCSDAFSSLKWFTDDGRYDVVASGSILGILLDDKDDALNPVGYVETIHMHPMDFEEFLWAMGVAQKHIDLIRESIRERKPIDPFILRTMHSLYRRFLVVGGMPEAVKMYAETKDYPRTRNVQTSILSYLRGDVEKYSRKTDRIKIIRCLDSIPSQLAKENNIFQYTDVSKANSSGRKYSSALGRLFTTDVALEAKNVNEPRAPLGTNERANSFKVYMHDCGLLMAMMDYAYAYEVVTKDPMANNGALMECATACAIYNSGRKVRFFRRTDGRMELDFVTSDVDGITAIEVKSGRKKRASSLKSAISVYGLHAVKLAEGNIMTDELGVLHLPLFAPWFMEEETPQLDDLDYSQLTVD